MREAYYRLADQLMEHLSGNEVLLASFAAENSDFVRFNQSLIRQATRVCQRRLTLELISGQRHASATCTLCSEPTGDLERALALLRELRDALDCVPEDPYLLYNTEPVNTEQIAPSRLPDAGQITDSVLAAGKGLDLVGILASGGIFAGFANSLGQRNWFATHCFHLDFSLYLQKDKAVKSSYAGFEWDPLAFDRITADAREQLAILARQPRTIPPGRYRVYLAPAAVKELFSLLCWSGFGVKVHRTKTSSLIRMTEQNALLSPKITLCENTAQGLAPAFYAGGFLRPSNLTIIEQGRFLQPLVCPRSAREYNLIPNGNESPESLDLAPGQLPADALLTCLDTGLYVTRLWYLNYSDRPACRITGMTRFATFWVENGHLLAPVEVMRFDETIYNMLGQNLLDLTSDRQFLPDEHTYGSRSTASMRLPGALIDKLTFTL